MNFKILVMTPVKHINGLQDILESSGSVKYLDNPSKGEVISILDDYDAIFTNPNIEYSFCYKILFGQAYLTEDEAFRSI